eukprot:gene37508-46274_t
MLSYCWGSNSKPHLVKSLGAALKQNNYDIWRDEEGSSIVGEMSGATDERMAEALEASSFVIICVSQEYKERPNCRLEAKYANQLVKKGKLRLIFLMMQNNYTTVSTPDSCDGWLGLMIGDALWYPMWSEGHVETTLKEIRKLVGSSAQLSANLATQGSVKVVSPLKTRPLSAVKNVATVASPHTPTTPAVVVPVVINYAAAYEILLSQTSSTRHQEVLNKLEELGVEAVDDFCELENEIFVEFSSMLKHAKANKFLNLLNLKK